MPRPPAPAVMTAKQLERIGKAMYGEQWKQPLAGDLDISYRNMQYMADGSRTIHIGIVRDLAKVVERRAGALAALGEELSVILRAAELAGG